jgi:hypothetical protein
MNINEFLEESFLKQLSSKRWDITKVNDWYSKQPWMVGCNYIPSNAINQLEMFQDDTLIQIASIKSSAGRKILDFVS